MTTINTTPHVIRIKTINGDILEYPPISNLYQLRCNQTIGTEQANLDNCIVVKSGTYVIDNTSLTADIYKTADTLIVSTIVANSADDIRKYLNRPLRILVPDLGPTAKRNAIGQIDYVERFIAY